MISKEIEVEHLDDLFLDIYIVGYTHQGESILCVLREKESILFTSVIDTYKPSSRTNYVADILTILGNPTIDMFIWTHPDEDHTIGLTDLMASFDSNHEASVFIPSHLSEIAGTEALGEFSKILAWYNPTGRGVVLKTKLNEISLTENEVRTLYNLTFIEKTTLAKIHFIAHFYLPNSSRAIRKANNWKSAKTNEHSIVHSFLFNGQQYVFCGDLTKNNVFLLPDEFYSSVKFIKIPHHGSKEPNNLPGIMMSKGVAEAASATTIYQMGADDPDDDVIEMYKKISSCIYSTGKGTTSDFGCIKLTMDKAGRLIAHNLEGNAELK